MTAGLHSELAGSGVRVTVVFPGAVAARTYPADQGAKDIVDGMERDAFRVLVGSDAKLMDRLYRLSPRRATAFIASQMKDLLSR